MLQFTYVKNKHWENTPSSKTQALKVTQGHLGNWLPLEAPIYGWFVIMSHNFEYLKIQLQAWRTTLDTHKTKILDSSGAAQKPKRNVGQLCDVFQRSWCKLNTLPDLQPLDT